MAVLTNLVVFGSAVKGGSNCQRGWAYPNFNNFAKTWFAYNIISRSLKYTVHLN